MSKKKRKVKEEILETIEDVLEDIVDEMEEEAEEEEVEEIVDLLFEQFQELRGNQVLIITDTQQLNLLGQTFRPIFCGPVVEVEQGHITLYPATIKLLNAPFYEFPTPLSIPFEKIAQFTTDFDCNMRFPLI